MIIKLSSSQTCEIPSEIIDPSDPSACECVSASPKTFNEVRCSSPSCGSSCSWGSCGENGGWYDEKTRIYASKIGTSAGASKMWISYSKIGMIVSLRLIYHQQSGLPYGESYLEISVIGEVQPQFKWWWRCARWSKRDEGPSFGDGWKPGWYPAHSWKADPERCFGPPFRKMSCNHTHFFVTYLHYLHWMDMVFHFRFQKNCWFPKSWGMGIPPVIIQSSWMTNDLVNPWWRLGYPVLGWPYSSVIAKDHGAPWPGKFSSIPMVINNQWCMEIN